jgi:hypothetical protein
MTKTKEQAAQDSPLSTTKRQNLRILAFTQSTAARLKMKEREFTCQGRANNITQADLQGLTPQINTDTQNRSTPKCTSSRSLRHCCTNKTWKIKLKRKRKSAKRLRNSYPESKANNTSQREMKALTLKGIERHQL